MHIPNPDQARVERTKILGYLLNQEHPDGQSKARFFKQCGFRRSQWRRLANALRNQARRSEVTTVRESSHGTRYVVEGAIETPTGNRLEVRTVWIVEQNQSEPGPRLVTAYPLSSTDR
ncbi:DUF6883 domain-containing protein [Salinibacter grassmerensis]|uniref:DUF6883 domain-containing protein n=1 Tax=Salinibacter grassmerensis TaxID=3040353 RepID=UPI003C6E717B